MRSYSLCYSVGPRELREANTHAAILRLCRSAGVLLGGRYWARTSDLFGVNEARYHCANRPGDLATGRHSNSYRRALRRWHY